MTEQSKNSQSGYAAHAYPLSDLTRPLPPLAAFQAFVAAAQLGSVSKAAEHLCRTQGAVATLLHPVLNEGFAFVDGRVARVGV